MLRLTRTSIRRISTKELTTARIKDISKPDENNLQQQAPNRISPWSKSQKPRAEAQDNVRFAVKDLAKQPRPYAAIDLIYKQPIRYIEHDNVAVCDGNGGAQGHPKVYINLDQNKAIPCGYCGLRFAQAAFKEDIESSQN
ncbi:hypothetical protein LJB42_004219 [Komagataella kurtzmanii]|nr:hypothetical protein LJB42_004219 [Komagataella kurtzmanii]